MHTSFFSITKLFFLTRPTKKGRRKNLYARLFMGEFEIEAALERLFICLFRSTIFFHPTYRAKWTLLALPKAALAFVIDLRPLKVKGKNSSHKFYMLLPPISRFMDVFFLLPRRPHFSDPFFTERERKKFDAVFFIMLGKQRMGVKSWSFAIGHLIWQRRLSLFPSGRHSKSGSPSIEKRREKAFVSMGTKRKKDLDVENLFQ